MGKIEVPNMFPGLDQVNQFRRAHAHNYLEAAVRLTYQIRRPETRAIDIADLSMFSTTEEEVLRMPMSVFRVIDIKSRANGSQFDITLEYCELPSKNDLVPQRWAS